MWVLDRFYMLSTFCIAILRVIYILPINLFLRVLLKKTKKKAKKIMAPLQHLLAKTPYFAE